MQTFTSMDMGQMHNLEILQTSGNKIFIAH